MKVILLENVEGLGKRGDHVTVANGYARNYLLPMKMALPATSAGARMFAEREQIRKRRVEKERHAAEELKKKLEKVSVSIEAQVGEDEKLFGSVTAQDISEALKAMGFEVDRRRVMLEEPIRVLGVYKVRLALHPEVSTDIKVWVTKKQGQTA